MRLLLLLLPQDKWYWDSSALRYSAAELNFAISFQKIRFAFFASSDVSALVANGFVLFFRLGRKDNKQQKVEIIKKIEQIATDIMEYSEKFRVNDSIAMLKAINAAFLASANESQ